MMPGDAQTVEAGDEHPQRQSDGYARLRKRIAAPAQAGHQHLQHLSTMWPMEDIYGCEAVAPPEQSTPPVKPGQAVNG